jgi:EmrB/QacA subfamily drug resistance transporter
VVGKLLHIDGVALRERVATRHREDTRLAGERGPDDEVRLLQRKPGCHQIDVVAAQSPDGVIPRCLDDLDVRFRVTRLELPDDLDELRTTSRSAQQAESQRPLEAARRDVRALEHARELVVGRAYVSQEPLAEWRQFDAATGAVNELRAELLLERAQALADPGGRQPELLGGTPEVQFLGEDEKETQLPQLDGLPHRELTLHDAFGFRLLIRNRLTATVAWMSIKEEKRKAWTTLILLGLAQFMVILDITVVNVALPSIAEDLAFAEGDLQWVITAYVLFTGGLLLLGGRATDLFGRRRVFLAGLMTFTLASLASGLAPSAEALIVARAVQGLGAAMLTPGALSIVTTTYEGGQRTAALAAWSAISSAGAAAGLVLGGVLTTALGWEWIFLINVPIGLATAIAVLQVVPAAPASAAGRRLDLLGAATVVAGLVLLVYGIEGTGEHGWGTERTVLLLIAAAALLAAFIAIERRIREPILPPSTWRNRSLVSGVGLVLVATALLIAVYFLNTIYLQDILGWSALETGLGFLPFVLVIGVAANVATKLIPRIGSRNLAALGLLLVGAGASLLALGPDVASYGVDVLPGFVVFGLGVGLVFPAASIAALSGVGEEEAGLASGLLTTGHELGAAFGVAAISAVATAAPTFVAGYADGFAAVAVAGAVLAVIALLATPTVRPGATPQVAND